MVEERISHRRYSFDAGSGTCLWAGDEATKARYGYGIQTGTLRDETRGWLANMTPTLPTAPNEVSAAAILLSMFCTTSSRGQSAGQ